MVWGNYCSPTHISLWITTVIHNDSSPGLVFFFFFCNFTSLFFGFFFNFFLKIIFVDFTF
jgi:hypothetical protein